MSLPDTLRLFSMTVQGILTNPLLYLYPQTPRDVAFGPYYSSGIRSHTFLPEAGSVM